MTDKDLDRTKILMDLGLIFNGEYFLYEDINFHWTDIVCMSDEEFNKAFEGAKKRMKLLKGEMNE